MLSVIYYTVGNKLYGYDFARKKCELLKTFDGYEITLFLSDILVETSSDYFYIALYDPSKPASTGGMVKKLWMMWIILSLRKRKEVSGRICVR